MRYHIGKYVFASKEEYEAGIRDARKLELLIRTKGTDLERARHILDQIYKENIEFETWLGKEFVEKFRRYVREEERKSSIWRRIWFYIKYPLVAAAAAILVSQLLSMPLDSLKNHASLEKLRKEKESVETTGTDTAGGFQAVQKKQGFSGRKENENTIREQDTKRILPAYQSLWEKNNDLAGWLTIGDTGIDYPVMFKEGDDEYYLHHNFEKQEDVNGLLSLDKRCDLEKEGGQYIIYGHNMRSGAMFGELMNYKRKSYYEANPTIRFDTLYEEGTYQIISVFLSRIFYEDEEAFRFYEKTEFKTQEEFQVFYDTIKQASLYDIKEQASANDTILTLVTCEYSQENGRLVIMAKKSKGV